MVGTKAPEFTLFDSSKQKVSLSDHKGRNIILLFFPQAFTSVCTEQLCTARDNMKIYEGLNAQVFGISVDSVFTLGKYKEEQNYNFPLLSDFNKEVSKAYNSLYETWIFDMKGVSKRSAFVIDGEGTIRYAEILDNPGLQPDFNAINNTLASLQ
ncbi:MAG TPA: redoxin domain-containing protein [Chitinophagaceae bacterium]|nr:redoxin domain-containing protein [Chitinophagaceae bacterium]